MGKIQILSENIRNKISAGEVVERPVSVVKELVENSIDANANKIIIEIKSSGNDLIGVIDNGEGMEREDALLAIKPFTTSKIRREEDLNCIKTLGFRGEALSSIASVSKMEIRTKPEIGQGTYLKVYGGEIKEVNPWEGDKGTSVRVFDLFYNVPVRKKFLKSPLTEGRLILEFVQKIALCYPEISFKYVQDEKDRFLTSGNGKIEDVILELFGEEVLDNLISFENEKGNYKIKGFISIPYKLLFSKPQDMIFLNRRIIKNSSILQGIKEGYSQRLKENLYPFVIINLFIPYEEVDVNVHPTKREVKFHREREVIDFIAQSIKSALDEHEEERRKKVFPVTKERKEKEEKIKTNNLKLPLLESSVKYIEKSSYLFPSFLDFNIVGQVFNNYLLIEYKDKLLIIDQHAAHERIKYEELKKKREKNLIEGNEIIFPLIIELSKEEKKILQEKREILESFSFYWEDFGPENIRITSIPNEFINLDNFSLENLFRELIQELNEKDLKNLEEKILKTIACHSAIRSGDILIEEEIHALIRTIVDEKIPLTCPHGRPIIWELTREEIEKKFQR
ncbi:MAG: DNA mismatch repair endonuclease MutL [Dictyoglomus sp.]|nr:DNA mismatch repair endonuclease MutL [Dictyoglomus sp.]MCX7941713.1 DNA mismatch repair endonuclease MutL [Dictyoglomaceae bacterium]MDW8189065.1 DNA mismatch repair endonuclease MutL [Dictyoglomus sp.]